MLQNRLDRFSHLSRRLVTILAGGGAVLVSGAVNAAPERIFHFASPGMSSILRGGSTFNCPSLRAYGQDSARRGLKHMSLRLASPALGLSVGPLLCLPAALDAADLSKLEQIPVEFTHNLRA